MRGVESETVTVQELLERDGPWCCLCGLPLDDDQTFDHLRPVSLGGEHRKYNLGLAHERCNKSKGNRGFVEWALSTRNPVRERSPLEN